MNQAKHQMIGFSNSKILKTNYLVKAMGMLSKSLVLTLVISILSVNLVIAQIFNTSTGQVKFFSETKLENISAVNNNVKVGFSASSKEIAIAIANSLFDFPNDLMEEHFNENYMESEKFPTSSFRGFIQESIDFKKEGAYPATAKGKLTVHGITKERELKGTLTVKADGTLNFKSNFDIALVDHNITVPKIVMVKVAEVIQVSADLNLTPKK